MLQKDYTYGCPHASDLLLLVLKATGPAGNNPVPLPAQTWLSLLLNGTILTLLREAAVLLALERGLSFMEVKSEDARLHNMRWFNHYFPGRNI